MKVEILRPFNSTPQGELVHPGDPDLDVDETRAGELERLGLAKRRGETKAAPAADNKMAPEPENKSLKLTGAVPARAPRRISGGKTKTKAK